MTLANMARMSTATTGTGTITLGSAVSGFISFASAGITNGQTVSYAIEDGSNREVGRGVYTSSGTTLTRSVLKSTNSNSAINLSGTAEVFITALAEDIVAPALVFIAAYAPSSVATLDITSGIDSTYDEYELHLQNFKPATTSTNLLLRTSTNGGSSFDSGASNYVANGIADTSINLSSDPSASAIAVSNTGTGVSGVLSIFRPATAAPCTVSFNGTVGNGAGSGVPGCVSGGYRNTSATVNAIRLLFSSGNISSGFAKLYGVQKS